MRHVFRIAVVVAGLLFSLAAIAQDQPSLGDVARQQRQKQQAKDKKTPAKVVTDDDLASHLNPKLSKTDDDKQADTDGELPSREPSEPRNEPSDGKQGAEQWKAEIQGQKAAIKSLQDQIDELNSSIHFAGGNCVANCEQWNQRQLQKQEEVKRLQEQLDQQKQRLDEMQETARKQGFGSSVYDP